MPLSSGLCVVRRVRRLACRVSPASGPGHSATTRGVDTRRSGAPIRLRESVPRSRPRRTTGTAHSPHRTRRVEAPLGTAESPISYLFVTLSDFIWSVVLIRCARCPRPRALGRATADLTPVLVCGLCLCVALCTVQHGSINAQPGTWGYQQPTSPRPAYFALPVPHSSTLRTRYIDSIVHSTAQFGYYVHPTAVASSPRPAHSVSFASIVHAMSGNWYALCGRGSWGPSRPPPAEHEDKGLHKWTATSQSGVPRSRLLPQIERWPLRPTLVPTIAYVLELSTALVGCGVGWAYNYSYGIEVREC